MNSVTNRLSLVRLDLEKHNQPFAFIETKLTKRYIDVYLPSLEDYYSLDFVDNKISIGPDNNTIISLRMFLNRILDGQYLSTLYDESCMINPHELWLTKIVQRRRSFPFLEQTKRVMGESSRLIETPLLIDGATNISEVIARISTLSKEQERQNFLDLCTFKSKEMYFFDLHIRSFKNELGELMVKFANATFKANIGTHILKNKLRALEYSLGIRPSEHENFDQLEAKNKSKILDIYKQQARAYNIFEYQTSSFDSRQLEVIEKFQDGTLLLGDLYKEMESMIDTYLRTQSKLDGSPAEVHRAFKEVTASWLRGKIK